MQTTLPAGDNIVVAVTETVNTANSSDYLPYVRLNSGPNGSWTALAESEYDLRHSAERSGFLNLEDRQMHQIPYLDSGASANPRYSVTSQESGGGAKMFGLAKIVAFSKPALWDAGYVDCPGQTMS